MRSFAMGRTGICLLVFGSAAQVQAFLRNARRPQSPSFTIDQRARPASPRDAFVYGLDGEVSAILDAEERVLDSASSLLQSLSSQLTMRTLRRLGCAFAPAPYTNTLHPETVESATLVSVDSTKLEIGVAVPSYGGLVQVLVPVAFRTSCDPRADLETCFMENIRKLEAYAVEVIADSERNLDNHEDLAEQQRISLALKEEPNVCELPLWWTFPGTNVGLEEEYKSMKRLLNEDDFAAELQALCRVQISRNIKIVQASVASVGPSGLFLRARIEKHWGEYDLGHDDTVDIFIQFSKEATTADSLQAAVLDLVESVELVEEVTPGPEPSNPEEDMAPAVSPVASVDEEEVEVILETQMKEKLSKEENSTGEESLPQENTTLNNIARARKQPKSSQEEAGLATKYAAIEDLEERAFTILKDLYMI